MGKLRQKDIDRFNQSYAVNEQTGCWEWQLSLNHNGYGRMKVGGFAVRAHRVSYLMHNGPIPLGMIVCHKCDNPKCVRPDHLWLGTNRDNQHDMISKGRKRLGDQRGERNPRSTLTQADAKRAIELIAEGWSNKAIAALFDVKHSTISAIRRGKTWTGLPRPEGSARRFFERYGSLSSRQEAS